MKPLPNLKALSQSARHLTDTILFTRFDDSQRTPLTGEESEDKDDILDFLNSAIDSQAKHVLEVFSDIQLNEDSIAVIDDVFEEGISIRYLLVQGTSQLDNDRTNDIANVTTNDTNNGALSGKQNKRLAKGIQKNPDSKTVFIPFRTKKGTPFERMYLLGTEAQIKQGIFDVIVEMVLQSGSAKHDFTVTKTEYVTKNMIRVYIKSDSILPKNEAGYAYRFVLTKSQGGQRKFSSNILNLPVKIWKKVEPTLTYLPYGEAVIGNTKKYALLTALEVYKRLPEPEQAKQNQSEQKQFEQGADKAKSSTVVEKRYYTLRQLKSNADPYTGEVDVYIHEDTAGSVWAKSLQASDTIKIDSHYHETIKEMTVGQPLFICDETSMPTVAAMLERWDIDTVPIVISITNDKADFSYFEDMVLLDRFKDKLEIMYINAKETDNLAEAVIAMIKQMNTHIDCAWGAIGKADFRPIKKYLREEHGLKGKLNRVRAYWV